MKVYTKIVVEIASGDVIAAESFDHDGPIAWCGGGGDTPKGQVSESGKIVRNLYNKGKGPLGSSLRNVLSQPADDPYTQRQADMLTQRIRGGYGARGLANSGISIQGEQDSLRDFLLNRGEQKQNQAISILGTGGTGPSFGPADPPRGFMGLK